eukprot:1160862-Pelagomonas_calceolata.AAC.12
MSAIAHSRSWGANKYDSRTALCALPIFKVVGSLALTFYLLFCGRSMNLHANVQGASHATVHTFASQHAGKSHAQLAYVLGEACKAAIEEAKVCQEQD